MAVLTGLDRLLQEPERLAGRPYGLLAHGAAVSADLRPAHLALASSAAGPPWVLFAPEHGYYGVEQDMVASADARDPWTGVPVRSLYGGSEDSLRPAAQALADLEVLVIDLQDVGVRYYTYAATAVWAAEVALAAGCEVWVLDRPNPLGGEVVEGNTRRQGLESFVGAFAVPVRHGLTLGELFRLEMRRRRWTEGYRVWTLEGWERGMAWRDLGRPWIAPSPNIPSPEIALVYPGMCLVEGTTVSEGRGTTRPFQLVGAPDLDPLELAAELDERPLPGVRFLPTYFRPQYHKHTGSLCGGVEVLVDDPDLFPAYRAGVELIRVLFRLTGGRDFWRRQPYEFVADRPAIDLLAGCEELRRHLEDGRALEPWIESWRPDEEAFRREREEVLLYGISSGEAR